MLILSCDDGKYNITWFVNCILGARQAMSMGGRGTGTTYGYGPVGTPQPTQATQSVYSDYYSPQLLTHRLGTTDSVVPQNVTVPKSTSSTSNQIP